MSKVLLDTDILIDILRGHEAIRTVLFDLTERAIPCCSVISVAELYAGMRPEEKHATDSLLDALVIVPVTQEIAEVAGRFKRRVKSRRLELADCLIAATAFLEGAMLATGKTKDYPMPEITVRNPFGASYSALRYSPSPNLLLLRKGFSLLILAESSAC